MSIDNRQKKLRLLDMETLAFIPTNSKLDTLYSYGIKHIYAITQQCCNDLGTKIKKRDQDFRKYDKVHDINCLFPSSTKETAL